MLVLLVLLGNSPYTMTLFEIWNYQPYRDDFASKRILYMNLSVRLSFAD